MQMLDTLREVGFVHLPALGDRASAGAILRSLGMPVQTEEIRLRPNAHAYVAKPGPVPMHTDHPEATLVAWHCEQQDAVDGATRLFDARACLEALSESEREKLRRIELCCPPLAGGPPTLRHPLLRRQGTVDLLFCSPWLHAASGCDEEQCQLDAFRERLRGYIAAQTIELRLLPGDLLVIDNQRVLHGRGAIEAASPRLLHRWWLQLPNENWREAG
ncbi:MAG: hypothetical protein RL277_1321 [Planctomycetota bacterium]